MENQSSNESIGKRIAALRKYNKLTQAQLADMIGSTSKHISEIERGITGISIDTQVLLGEHLHCSLDYLIKGTEFQTVDYLLPDSILEILQTRDEHEFSVLLKYLKMYEEIRSLKD